MDSWINGWLDGWINWWMDGWMDGWIDRWVNEWMNGWVGEWMNGVQINGWLDGWINGWMDGWMDGWIDRWVNEWMNGWVGECMNGVQMDDTPRSSHFVLPQKHWCRLNSVPSPEVLLPIFSFKFWQSYLFPSFLQLLSLAASVGLFGFFLLFNFSILI